MKTVIWYKVIDKKTNKTLFLSDNLARINRIIMAMGWRAGTRILAMK